MPRACTVCGRPDRDEIDRLLSERPIRDVAGQTGVPKSTLARHKLAHPPAALVLARDREVERHQRLFEEAQALRRSMSGWGAIRDQAEWLDVCAQAEADYGRRQAGRGPYGQGTDTPLTWKGPLPEE